MSASTMGFDLRTEAGRRNLRTTFKNKSYKKPSLWLVIRHTLMPMWCAIVGHRTYDTNAGGTPELACLRCNHYV